MERKIAINPRFNTSFEELKTTLADVAIEAGHNLPPEDRINPFTLFAVDGKVVNKKLNPDVDVKNYYTEKTKRDKEEKAAGMCIRDALLTMPDKTLAVWFSPSYKDFGEGRITVGYIRESENSKLMESYGLITNLSGEQMLSIAWQLNEFALKENELNTPDDLRSTALIFELPTLEDNPWKFLSNYIPMPKVWEKIIDGSASENRVKIEKELDFVARKVFPLITNSRNIYDLHQAAIIAEHEMANSGKRIDHTRLDCPTAIQGNFTLNYIVINEHAQIVHKSTESGTYVRKCPFCNKRINAVIRPGYKCSCGQVYEGVC